MNKNKILFLLYFFPPIASTATRRNAYIYKYLGDLFDEKFVFTTRNRDIFPNDSFYDFLLKSDLPIEVIPTFDYRTFLNLFQSDKGTTKKTIHLSSDVKKKPLVRFLTRLLDGFPLNILFQEGGIYYSLAGTYKAYRLIKKEKITHVWSSFRPYSDHFTAYLIKKIFPNIVWVADFRDLHVEPLYDNVYFIPFQHWCNRFFIKKADVVTTISSGLATHLKKYNPNVYVLKSGIDITKTEFDTSQFEKFTICFTGNMANGERNPAALLEVVKTLSGKKIISSENFQILYAGAEDHYWLTAVAKWGVSDFFVSKSSVSTSEATSFQRKSHINLLLTSATPEWTGVLTGKFGEYLSAKNPILVLINGTKDVEFEEVVENLEAGIVAYSDSFDEIKKFVVSKFNEWKATGEVKSTVKMEKLKELEWSFLIKKFVENQLKSSFEA